MHAAKVKVESHDLVGSTLYYHQQEAPESRIIDEFLTLLNSLSTCLCHACAEDVALDVIVLSIFASYEKEMVQHNIHQ